MENIYEAILDLEKNHLAGAVCTIIDTHGSTPRHEGSKMLVREDGSFIGSVGAARSKTGFAKKPSNHSWTEKSGS